MSSSIEPEFNPGLNSLCVLEVFGPDKNTVEVATILMQKALGDRFVFHDIKASRKQDPGLAIVSRCFMAVREQDREQCKREKKDRKNRITLDSGKSEHDER